MCNKLHRNTAVCCTSYRRRRRIPGYG